MLLNFSIIIFTLFFLNQTFIQMNQGLFKQSLAGTTAFSSSSSATELNLVRQSCAQLKEVEWKVINILSMILFQLSYLWRTVAIISFTKHTIQDTMILHRLLRYYSMIEKVSITNRAECLKLLSDLAINYKLYEHEAFFTMEEGVGKLKLDHSPYIKCLLFSDKKPNTHFMVLAEMNTKPDKAYWKKVGTTHNNVRMSKEEVLQNVLKSKKGALNPFSLANDNEHLIKKLIIEDKLFNFEHWAFHPMDNSATVELPRGQFFKFITHCGIQHESLNLLEALEKTEEGGKKGDKQKKQAKGEVKKQEVNLLGMQAKKATDFPAWYQQVIVKSGLIDYYDVSGCYILRPWAYSIWQKIQTFFDKLIKANGVENAYFPMFVSKRSLEIEKNHVEGFAPEVAWVTRSGKSELAEPIAIRPTSETIMYPAYANWIKSHRDLPLKLNQWTNIVRWQFKHPTPFIRTREFLWQEGHTAHATYEQAEKEMYDNLEFYYLVYKEMLAIPVCKGIKTESERFPGGFRTSTVQTWIPENGRAIQAATSHNLGQNFAKMFGIEFENEKKEKNLVWQTSWGLTTRSIGIMSMYHGDDKGLVLPPRVANVQVIIVPIPFKGKEEEVNQAANALFTTLKKTDIRVQIDLRDNYNPGWKFNHWELKGVPIRLEIGPKDIQRQEVRVVIRFNGDKHQIKWDALPKELPILLENIQQKMYQRALERFHEKVKSAKNWQDFMNHLNSRNVVLTPWCEIKECEEKVKERSGIETKESVMEGEHSLTGQAKTLCIPLQYAPLHAEDVCFHCGQPAKVRVYWGRSY